MKEVKTSPKPQIPEHKRPFLLHIEPLSSQDLICIARKQILPIVEDIVVSNAKQIKNYGFLRAPTCRDGQFFAKQTMVYEDKLMHVIRLVVAVRGLFQKYISEDDYVMLMVPKKPVLSNFLVSRCNKAIFDFVTLQYNEEPHYELSSRVWSTMNLRLFRPIILITDLPSFRNIIRMSWEEFNDAWKRLSSNVSVSSTKVSNTGAIQKA